MFYGVHECAICAGEPLVENDLPSHPPSPEEDVLTVGQNDVENVRDSFWTTTTSRYNFSHLVLLELSFLFSLTHFECRQNSLYVKLNYILFPILSLTALFPMQSDAPHPAETSSIFISCFFFLKLM